MIKANQKGQFRICYVFIQPTRTLLMEIPMYDETFNLYIEGRIHIVVVAKKNQILLRPTKVIFNPLFVGRCKVVKIANQNDGFDAPLNSKDQYNAKTSRR